MRCETEVIHYGWLEGPPYMSKEEWQKSHICGASWTGRVTDNRDEVTCSVCIGDWVAIALHFHDLMDDEGHPIGHT